MPGLVPELSRLRSHNPAGLFPRFGGQQESCGGAQDGSGGQRGDKFMVRGQVGPSFASCFSMTRFTMLDAPYADVIGKRSDSVPAKMVMRY